jgi:hypothetical protein
VTDVGLSLIPLKGPHTGQNLFETFIDVVEKEFGILQKVYKLIATTILYVLYINYISRLAYGGYH